MPMMYALARISMSDVSMSDVMRYLPTLTIFLSSVIHILRWDKFRAEVNARQWIVVHLMLATLLFALPPHSAVASFGRALTLFIARWPCLFPEAPIVLIHGGPLGHSCAKVCEVVAGILLWKVSRGVWPALELGPWPDASVLLVVLLISAIVNLVLWLWSRSFRTRGNHDGVNEMVASSVGRSFSRNEHVAIAVSAVANAVCEEIMSRGLWRLEFARSVIGVASDAPMSLINSNILQAAIFGIWHYHGIPSGLPGVALTFVYGLVMGLLMDYGQGLLLPILAHSIADYFIFAIIARQKQTEGGSVGKSKEL